MAWIGIARCQQPFVAEDDGFFLRNETLNRFSALSNSRGFRGVQGRRFLIFFAVSGIMDRITRGGRGTDATVVEMGLSKALAESRSTFAFNGPFEKHVF